jgi:hypothetical protein
MFPKDHPAYGLPASLGAFHADIFEVRLGLSDGSTTAVYAHEGCAKTCCESYAGGPSQTVDDLWTAAIDGWLDEMEVAEALAGTTPEAWRVAEVRRSQTEKMREKSATHIILTRRFTDGRGSVV